MKYLWLLYKNVMRNRRRSLLTVSSIAVSLFLVTTLLTLLNELQNPIETPASALRLITRHKVSLFNSLPIAYRQKIAAVEGVEAVMGAMWFGGVYKDPSNFFGQFAADTEQFFQVNADMIVPEVQKAGVPEGPYRLHCRDQPGQAIRLEDWRQDSPERSSLSV